MSNVHFDEVGRNCAGAVAITQICPGGKVEIIYSQERRSQQPMYPAPAAR